MPRVHVYKCTNTCYSPKVFGVVRQWWFESGEKPFYKRPVLQSRYDKPQASTFVLYSQYIRVERYR